MGTIHQHPAFNAILFNTILKVPPDSERRTGEWLTEQVRSTLSDRPSQIEVLVVGIGDGRLEVPIIDALLGLGRQIDVLAVDYSPQFVRLLRERLFVHQYEQFSEFEFHKRTASANVRLLLHVEDAERDTLPWLRRTGRDFDLILSFFVLNFFADWRGGLINLLAMLKPFGHFCLGQDEGDICFLDNAFPTDLDPILAAPGRRTFHEFWSRYYTRRAELGHRWEPEIRPADMTLVVEALAGIAERGLGRVAHHRELWSSSSVGTLGEWLEIVRGDRQVFNCLMVPDKDARATLHAELTAWIEEARIDLDAPLELELGHRLTDFTAHGALGTPSVESIVRSIVPALSVADCVAQLKTIYARSLEQLFASGLDEGSPRFAAIEHAVNQHFDRRLRALRDRTSGHVDIWRALARDLARVDVLNERF